MDELSRVAAELYSSPLGDFVSRRNERAKEADDRGLAAAIRALRKPSVAAWVVNVFARERRGELDEALQLAEELREAQADLDAASLSKLGRERRALIARLAARAAELARARGEKISTGTVDAVQQTFNAAFFDEQASQAVASGRLVRELEPAASAGIDWDEAVGGGAADPGSAVPTAPADELEARRRRRQRERAVQEAESDLARAENELKAAQREERSCVGAVEEAAAAITRLERELGHARQEAARAEKEAGASEKRRVDAEDALRAAERRVEAAKEATDSGS